MKKRGALLQRVSVLEEVAGLVDALVIAGVALHEAVVLRLETILSISIGRNYQPEYLWPQLLADILGRILQDS
jgi:hypothetical protein